MGISNRADQRLVLCFALLALITLSLPAAAATFSVTAKRCSTSPGGYQWAIEQANSTPGRDTISIDIPEFYVDSCSRSDPGEDLPIAFTESVDIVGNGNTVNGNLAWITPNGGYRPRGQCPDSLDQWINKGGALLNVEPGIEVTIKGLKMTWLSSIGIVRENAKLTIEDSEIRDVVSAWKACNGSILTALPGADVTLKKTVIFFMSVPSEGIRSTQFPMDTALIYGRDGDLIMENVKMANSFGEHAAAVWWTGGSVKVVSSTFLDSSGFWLVNSTMDFVNSAFQLYGFDLANFSENIILGGGSVLNSEASTFYWESIGCTNCNITQASGSGATKGLGFVGYQNTTYGPSSVRFKSTALGSIDAPEPLQKLWGDPQVFSSDAYTWVQPTTGQDATELAAILPNASTATPGLTTQFLANIQEQQVPIIPGVLVEAVPDAGVGGVNQLFSPIDGLPIALDVNGSPRVYANGTRNIGAVQNSDAPSLSATSGDSQVTLNWSPTAVGQVVGYEVCTSATPLTDPLTGACPGTPAAVGPSETSEVVSGLTNGAPYWFAVRGTSTIWSKVATATPMGPLGVAQPTAATIGDGSVQVYWAAPTTTGGYTGLVSYNLVYRPIGTQAWLVGPQGITAQTTLLGGLVNGTTYEIGVLAQTDDGGHSPTAGTITATPQAAPMLSYATLSSWPQNTPLTLTPTVGQLQGSGAYTIEAGALPSGMALEPSTGVISGTPTAQQSTSATIRLTDGTTGLSTDATVPLSIVAPSPSPQIWYPAIQATVGVGPISATPTQAGIPAGAVWSVLSGDSLPTGFTLDPSTGVINGTPTTPPGKVVDITIQACWGAGGSCNIGQELLAPMLFWIVPNLQYPANTQSTAGVAATVTPTVSLWSGGVFSIESGSLPTGMSLNPVTGVISGTPQTANTYPLTIRYSTGVNVFVPPLEYVYSTTQINVASPAITLTYPAINGSSGQFLSVLPNATGLMGTPVYSLVSGSLPQGLRLNSATGAITGVPTDPAGSYPVVIQVTDPYGSQRTSVVIRIYSVAAAPALSPPALALLLVILMALTAGRVRQARRRGQR